MDIFPYMNDIWFHDIDEFTENVDKNRKDMLQADEGLLLKKSVIDIDNIDKLPDGRLQSIYKGYQFDSFSTKKKVNTCM